jgi:hypothetical protein
VEIWIDEPVTNDFFDFLDDEVGQVLDVVEFVLLTNFASHCDVRHGFVHEAEEAISLRRTELYLTTNLNEVQVEQYWHACITITRPIYP